MRSLVASPGALAALSAALSASAATLDQVKARSPIDLRRKPAFYP